MEYPYGESWRRIFVLPFNSYVTKLMMGEGHKISFICLARNYDEARMEVGRTVPRTQVSVKCKHARYTLP